MWFIALMPSFVRERAAELVQPALRVVLDCGQLDLHHLRDVLMSPSECMDQDDRSALPLRELFERSFEVHIDLKRITYGHVLEILNWMRNLTGSCVSNGATSPYGD